MRHTKKNRKQRRNGKNKKRFSKKHGGDVGRILRGFQGAKDALKLGITSAKNAVTSRVSSALSTATDKIASATSAFQDTPLGNLNWHLQMRKPNTVTADIVNKIQPDQYNKITWKENEAAITKDGLEALLTLAEYFLNKNKNNTNVYDNYKNDLNLLRHYIDKYESSKNEENNQEIENNDANLVQERIKDFNINRRSKNADDIKELFKFVLEKGNKNHLIEFSTNFKFLKEFNYNEKFNDGTTPLFAAASNKSPEILNHILTDKDIKGNVSFDKDSENNTVLHIACMNNNPNILKVLFTKMNTQQDNTPPVNNKNLATSFKNLFTSKKKDNSDDVFKPIAIDDKTFNKIASFINEKNNPNKRPIDIICEKPITEINGEAIKLLVDNGSKIFEANKLLSEKIKILDNQINVINGKINKQTVEVSDDMNNFNKNKSLKEVEKQKCQEVMKPITDKINSIKESEKENIIKIEANKQKAINIALKLTNTKETKNFVLDDFVEGSTIRTTPKPGGALYFFKQTPTQDQLDYFKKESEAQLYLILDQVIDKIIEQYPSQGDKERTIDPNYDNTITAIVEPNSETNPDLKGTTTEANTSLKQGGRHRVTKRLQHNLRRYKL